VFLLWEFIVFHGVSILLSDPLVVWCKNFEVVCGMASSMHLVS
jgi:hypothetical protein